MRKIYFLSPLILQTFIWPITYTLFFVLFLSLKVRGLENVKNLKRGVIFATNHTDELDPILVPASLPFLSHLMPMFYTSRERKFYKKDALRKHFYGGLFFKAWGAYRVVVGHMNYSVALRDHIQIINDGGSVCIFPEGHTTKDGRLLPAKGGVAYLAYKTGAPIIPVAINGLFGITKKRFFTRKYKVTLQFGSPIYSKDILSSNPKHDEFREGAQKVMDEISRLMKLDQSPN